MNENTLTLAGRLTADPELRFTPSGAAVASFTVAHNDRTFDKTTNEWKDAGETLFLRCSAWRKTGENAAESLRKGDAVFVTGRLKQRSYETSDGEKRTVVELDVDTLSVPLDRYSVQINRESRQPAMAGAGAPASSDPFDEPPF
ncbi:MAG: single-strand DNA-binding protein [Actinomycetota bacterium]|nr:single-strand DNA-binding protein [Actinomycetota bacterium]